MNPSISIIIPVYNVSGYIIDCLQSVAAQDYPGNIECILVDDCSTDDSIAKALAFIQSQSSAVSFRIIRHEQNKKQSAARNTGIRAAQGEYVFFVDSDDWLDSDTLSQMVTVLNAHPDCQMVQAGTKRTQPEVFPWMDCETWKDKGLVYSDDRQWIIDTCSLKINMIPMMPYSKLIKRSYLTDNNLFFYEGIYHEDDLWLVHIAKTLQSVAFLHKNIYNYRIRTDSTVGGGKIIHYKDREIVWLETMRLLDKDFCPPLLLRQIEWDTTNFLERTHDYEARKILIRIKFRLMRYCSFKFRLRIIKRLFLSLLRGTND